MVVGQGGDNEGIKKLVKQYIPESETNREHGQELDVTLPLAQVAKFSGRYIGKVGYTLL